MEQEEAQTVMDRLVDDAACIIPHERWIELMDAITTLMPKSKFANNDR
tara:strand:- start:329 stop:472 length:144 start_codon:yes stop_codon:yes gene_type:complete